jgi:hypothetical protein
MLRRQVSRRPLVRKIAKAVVPKALSAFSKEIQDFERRFRLDTRTAEDKTGTQEGNITREYVIWAYRILLDRDPENEAAILGKLRAWGTTKELRTDFLASPEFRPKNR